MVGCFSTTPANIGLMRDEDRQWVAQYGSLFCVLNHLGQVVTWKMTNSVSFATVEDALLALKTRLEAQGKKLKEFYIDNC